MYLEYSPDGKWIVHNGDTEFECSSDAEAYEQMDFIRESWS